MKKTLFIICLFSFFCFACAKDLKDDGFFVPPFIETTEDTLKGKLNKSSLDTTFNAYKIKSNLNKLVDTTKNTSVSLLKNKAINETEAVSVNTTNNGFVNSIVKTKTSINSLKATNFKNNSTNTTIKEDNQKAKTLKINTDSLVKNKNTITVIKKTTSTNNTSAKPLFINKGNKQENLISGKTPKINDKQISESVKSLEIKKTSDKSKNKTEFESAVYNTQKTKEPKPFKLRVLRKSDSYQTNNNYTFLLEILNISDEEKQFSLEALMPGGWKVISISDIKSLKENEKKIALISFYIPSNSASGNTKAELLIKSKNNYIMQSLYVDLNVANNYDLEVFNVFAPQQLQAGESIQTRVAIKNKGNVDQEITLNSKNKIEGESTIVIPKDSTIVVDLSQKTDPKANSFRTISTSLDVFSKNSGKTYSAYNTVEVIPTKIKQKDPFFRYPLQASLYYSSFTNQNDHYSSVSAELRGNGYLDLNKDHHLNFIVRGPRKENLRRFSVSDQYSLIYRYKNRTTLHLGDHSHYINKLGFGSRYGMGFRLDHNIEKWTLSAFYSKPRFYSYNSKPLYGAKAEYHVSDSINVGVTVEKSYGNTYNYSGFSNENQNIKGQIITLDYDYRNKGTYINTEVSTSISNKNADYASDLNVSQSFKNFTYNSYLILAGKNYFGNVSNSLQLTNSLNYFKKGLDVGIGHAFSKVNRRLDPLYYTAEPYYENYYATIGYRFGNKHYLRFRFDKRVREDQLDPKDFHYEEYGVNYNFTYTDKLFSGSFGGRFAKTQNKLSQNLEYRNTYSHNASVSYKLFTGFNIRGGLYHNYTNRYGSSGLNTNYVRYNLGFNYNISKHFRINANYNSGFSPEENYKKREYLKLGLFAQINKKHRFEIRANYFENPGAVNDKELLAYGKYTYSFGVALKKVLEQGGVSGNVYATDASINIKGVKVYTAGKTIVTDQNGVFELNNLPLGINYVFVDESSLPLNVVVAVKNPIKMNVEKDKKVSLEISLAKAGNLVGKLNINRSSFNKTNLEGYIKLENENFTYYTESNTEGSFKFQNIVPGNYTLNVIRFKNNTESLKAPKNLTVEVKNGRITEFNISVKGKERKIKFNNNNFNIATK